MDAITKLILYPQFARNRLEQVLVNANRELIARMEKKIRAALPRIWSEVKDGEKVNHA